MEIESDDQGSQVVSILTVQINDQLKPRPNNWTALGHVALNR